MVVPLRALTYEKVAAQTLGSYRRIDAHPLRYNLGPAEHDLCSTEHGKVGEYKMRGWQASLQKQHARILWKNHDKSEKVIVKTYQGT